MARQIMVLALVFVAIVGFASAQQANPPQASSAAAPPANAPKAKASAAAPSGLQSNAPAPAAGPAIEPGKMPDIAMPGPVGSHEKRAEAPSNSGSSVLPASAVVAGIAVTGFFY